MTAAAEFRPPGPRLRGSRTPAYGSCDDPGDGGCRPRSRAASCLSRCNNIDHSILRNSEFVAMNGGLICPVTGSEGYERPRISCRTPSDPEGRRDLGNHHSGAGILRVMSKWALSGRKPVRDNPDEKIRVIA